MSKNVKKLGKVREINLIVVVVVVSILVPSAKQTILGSLRPRSQEDDCKRKR